MKFSEGEWRLASYRATVIGTIIGLISLFIILVSVQIGFFQLESSSDTIKNLAELIEANKNQTKALEVAIREIQHQTIVNAYNTGGSFDVKIEKCRGAEKFDSEGNLEQYLVFRPVMINEKGQDSTVPFRIFGNLEFRGSTEKNNFSQSFFKRINLDPYVYDPTKDRLKIEQNVQDILDGAKGQYKFVLVDYEYSFRPFSNALDISIADQTEYRHQSIAQWKLTENEKWAVLCLQ